MVLFACCQSDCIYGSISIRTNYFFKFGSIYTYSCTDGVDEFKKMGKRMPYMIHTMTDETYAINLTLESEGPEKEDTMFWVAFFSRCYWMIGSVAGGVLGQIIPFDMEGIDFCMTALFLIIFVDQWEKNKNHVPAILGVSVAFICLLIVGAQNFMLPALMIVSGILLVFKQKEGVLNE